MNAFNVISRGIHRGNHTTILHIACNRLLSTNAAKVSSPSSSERIKKSLPPPIEIVRLQFDIIRKLVLISSFNLCVHV